MNSEFNLPSGAFCIANKDAASYVLRKEAFTGSHLYSRWRKEMYVVFSYGPHFPLLVWSEEQWFYNEDKYSVSTSRNLANCGGSRGTAVPTAQLQEIVRCGSVAEAVARRMGENPTYFAKLMDIILNQDMAYDFAPPKLSTQEIPI